MAGQRRRWDRSGGIQDRSQGSAAKGRQAASFHTTWVGLFANLFDTGHGELIFTQRRIANPRLTLPDCRGLLFGPRRDGPWREDGEAWSGRIARDASQPPSCSPFGKGPTLVQNDPNLRSTLTRSLQCILIPQVLNLPCYQPSVAFNQSSDAEACKLCGTFPSEVLCHKCPPTVIPHLRHDLDPTLIGNKSGVCPLCAGKSFVPDGKPGWNICACGRAIEKTEERMKAFLLEMDGDEEGRRRVEGMKEEAERGRGRQMSRG